MSLFLMRQGSYPSLPEMGVDIMQYLYDVNFSVDNLKSIVSAQCSMLSPLISTGELDIQKVDMDAYFVIAIVIPAIIQEKKVKYLLGFKSYQDRRRVLDNAYEMEIRTFVQSGY